MTQYAQQSDILDILKQTRLFKSYHNELLARLVSISSMISFQQGSRIVSEGIDNRSIYVLISGAVSVYSGTEVMNRLARKGDLFGELSSITSNKTTSTVIAETPVDVLIVPAGDIFASEDVALKTMVFKIAFDILTDKIKLTRTRVYGFQAVSRELSEKTQRLALSENSLKRNEFILQSVLSSMSEGVAVTNAQGKLVHMNPAFERMVGGPPIPDDIIDWPRGLGLYHSDGITRYDPNDLLSALTSESRGSSTIELFLSNERTPDGLWLQVSGRPLKFEETELEGIVIVLHDITQKTKEKIALQTAKRQAEEMAVAKSNFLAVISHELRTPLNSILGTTDLLYETGLTEEQTDHMGAIKAGGENLYTVIRNILDYNALESGSYGEIAKPFSIVECIEEIKDRYQTTAIKKKITFNTQIDDSLPEKIIGCERAVKQILRNLVDNAIKFTPSGSVELVAQYDRNDLKNRILLKVKDSGIGMSQNDISALFQPFAQADSSYSRSFEGTGIGLSICQRIVTLIGGEISVHSETGKGTEVTVAIECDELTPGEQTMTSETSKDIQKGIELNGDFASHFPMDILVAEDNPLNQKLIIKMLQKLGYDPIVVSNGVEAVEAVKNKLYHLLLMDLQMPEVDGMEATKLILEQVPEEKQPKIVALTAAVSNDVREQCLAIGMKGFISKPISIQKLSQVLQENC